MRPQQVAALSGGSNSPSVVKQIQEQENKPTDSPTQTSKPEQQQDDKEGEVKKEKKKVKKPKTPKVRLRWVVTFPSLAFYHNYTNDVEEYNF